MEPFRPVVLENGIDDGDLPSSIRPTVSLFDDDDDEEVEEGEADDVANGDGDEVDDEIDSSNVATDHNASDAETIRLAGPPSKPPPPPPPPIFDGLSLSMLPVDSIAIDTINEEERVKQLRHRLQQINQERRICRLRQMQCDNILQKLESTYNIRQQEQQRLLADYMGYTRGNTMHMSDYPITTTTSHSMTLSQYWNVTASDAFMIMLEHGNTIASINGLRLGAMVTLTIPSSSSLSSSSTPTPTRNSSSSTSQSHMNTGGRTTETTDTINPMSQSHGPIHSATTETSSVSQAPVTAVTMAITKYKIPWAEINAALGQVALMITTMEQNLQHYYSSTNTKPGLLCKHEFICMGSTSKIGVRKPSSSSTTGGATINFYNLFYTEENTIFHMLLNTKKRNFDIALQLLLGSVYDLCKIIHDRDRTVYIPYDMNLKQWTIANIPITYFSGPTTSDSRSNSAANGNTNATNVHEHDELWTRAMKYLLSNLKHAMSYRGIGLWNVINTAATTTIKANGTGT